MDESKSKFPVRPQRKSFRTAFLMGSKKENSANNERGRNTEVRAKKRIINLVPSPGGAKQFCLVEGGAESAGNNSLLE